MFLRIPQFCGLLLGHTRLDALLDVGFFQLVHEAGLRNSEVFRDLVQRGFVLPGDRDNITAKLGWVGLGHDDIFPVKTKLHRSGVNQTRGSPDCDAPKELQPPCVRV